MHTEAHGPLPTPADQKIAPHQPAYIEVEARKEELEGQFFATDDSMRDIRDKANSEIQTRIDDLDDRYHNAFEEVNEQATEKLDLETLIDQHPDIPIEYIDQLRTLDRLRVALEASDTELEKYAPERLAVVLAKAKDLEARIDYDAFVAIASKRLDDTKAQFTFRLEPDKAFFDMCQVTSIRYLVEQHPDSLNYGTLRSMDLDLESLRQKYTEMGIIRDAPVEVTPVPTYPEDFVLSVRNKLEQAHILNIRYRSSKTRYSNNRLQELGELIQVLNAKPDEPTSYSDVISRAPLLLNERYAQALKKALADRYEELNPIEFSFDKNTDAYRQEVARMREINPLEAVSNMELVGLDGQLPAGLTRAHIISQMLFSIPPVALERLKKFSIRPMTLEENKEDTTLGFCNLYGLQGYEIVISDQKITEDINYNTALMGDRELAEFAAREKALYTVTHELAHAFHDALPLAAVQEWHTVATANPTHVTPYVKSMYKQEHSHRYMEDFAESVALFITKPYELKESSPERYECLQRLYTEFMPTYTDIIRPHQEETIEKHAQFKRALAEATAQQNTKRP